MAAVFCPSTSALFAGLAGAALVAVAALFLVFYWLGTGRKFLALGLAGIVCFAGLTAFLVYDHDTAIAEENAWSFTYDVWLQGPAGVTQWVVIPRTVDSTLVSSLSSSGGQANWSLVDTPHGAGLYAQYTGSVNLSESTILYQPVVNPPDANLTMTTLNATTNYVFGTSWILSSGSPEQHVVLRTWLAWQGGWYLDTDLQAGWAGYEVRYNPQLPGAIAC